MTCGIWWSFEGTTGETMCERQAMPKWAASEFGKGQENTGVSESFGSVMRRIDFDGIGLSIEEPWWYCAFFHPG